ISKYLKSIPARRSLLERSPYCLTTDRTPVLLKRATPNLKQNTAIWRPSPRR
ncbi:hypothetical protein BGZ65_006170, partial [Modicella reniformis]